MANALDVLLDSWQTKNSMYAAALCTLKIVIQSVELIAGGMAQNVYLFVLCLSISICWETAMRFARLETRFRSVHR